VYGTYIIDHYLGLAQGQIRVYVSKLVIIGGIRVVAFLAVYPLTFLFAEQVGLDGFAIWSQVIAAVLLLFPVIGVGLPQYLIINHSNKAGFIQQDLERVALITILCVGGGLILGVLILSAIVSPVVDAMLMISVVGIAVLLAYNLLRVELARINGFLLRSELLRALYFPVFQLLVLTTLLLFVTNKIQEMSWVLFVVVLFFIGVECLLAQKKLFSGLIRRFKYIELIRLYKLSILALLPSLALLLNQYADVFVISANEGLESAGEYSLYFRLMMPFSLVFTSVNAIVITNCANAVKRDDQSVLLQQIYKASMLCFAAIAFGAVVMSLLILYFQDYLTILEGVDIRLYGLLCFSFLVHSMFGPIIPVYQMKFGSVRIILSFLVLFTLKIYLWLMLPVDGWVTLFLMTLLVVFLVKLYCFCCVRNQREPSFCI